MMTKEVQTELATANEFSLSVSSCINAEDTTEAVDITALHAEIARQAELRTAIVADLESVA